MSRYYLDYASCYADQQDERARNNLPELPLRPSRYPSWGRVLRLLQPSEVVAEQYNHPGATHEQEPQT